MAKMVNKKRVGKKPLSKAEVKEVQKIVKSELQQEQEFKWFGSGFAAVSVFSGIGYQQQNMTAITNGTGDNNRIGDSINIKSITAKVAIVGPAVSSNTHQFIRLMIFQFKDTATITTSPSINEILNTDIATGVRSTFGFRNIQYKHKYQMLYDKVFRVLESDNANYVSDDHVKWVEISVPLKYARKKIQFKTGTTESDGSIWIAAIGSEPSSAINATVACEYRVHFTDS